MDFLHFFVMFLSILTFSPKNSTFQKYLLTRDLPGKCSGDIFITGFSAKWQQINFFKWRWAKPESFKLHLLHKEGVNQKKQNMWTTSYNGINSGYQHFIDLESYLGLAASFFQNQRLAYTLVEFFLIFQIFWRSVNFLNVLMKWPRGW